MLLVIIWYFFNNYFWPRLASLFHTPVYQHYATFWEVLCSWHAQRYQFLPMAKSHNLVCVYIYANGEKTTSVTVNVFNATIALFFFLVRQFHWFGHGCFCYQKFSICVISILWKCSKNTQKDSKHS